METHSKNVGIKPETKWRINKIHESQGIYLLFVYLLFVYYLLICLSIY